MTIGPKLLLTSAGITNPSLRTALIEMLGKPIEESTALCIPTASYGHPAVSAHQAWKFTAADTVFDGPLSIVIDPRQPPDRPGNYDGKVHGIVAVIVKLDVVQFRVVRMGQELIDEHRVERRGGCGMRCRRTS